MNSKTKEKDPIIVLITGAGAPGAPGIIKSLRLVKERKIKIVGTDIRQEAVGFSMIDDFYTVPAATNPRYLNKLLTISQKERVDVILPLNTEELLILAKNKRRFEHKNIKVSISSTSALNIANNKYRLMESVKNEVPVPEFYKVNSFTEFETAVKNLQYPKKDVCFKPPISNGLRGFRHLTRKIDRLDLLINQKPNNTVTSLEDIEPVLKNAKPFPELLVMEFLPGEEFSVDLLVDKGKSLVIIPRKRERIRMGISFIGKTVKDQNIINYSEQIVMKLKLNGNIGLQYKRDEDGIPKIIECNPRLQGTIVLCTNAGANLVYGAVKLALGESVSQYKIKWGMKMIRYWNEVYTYRNRFVSE